MQSFKTHLSEVSKFSHLDTGPLMKANAWIKRQKLSKMVQEEDLRGETLAIGYLQKFSGKDQPIAVRVDNEASIVRYFKKGLNNPHSFYYDTGRGHKQTDDQIVITGSVHIDKDGHPTPKGKVDMNLNTTLMVFK